MLERILLLLLLLVVALVIALLAVRAKVALRAAHGGGGPYTKVAIGNIRQAPKVYEYTNTVTGEKRFHRSLVQYYIPPKSNEQIRAVVKHGSIHDYGRLLTLLGKFWLGPKTKIHELAELKDSDAYAIVAKQWRTRSASDTAERYHNAKASTIYTHLKPYLQDRNFEIRKDSGTLLDIGCGTGHVAAALGRLLNNSTVHGVDFQATNDSGIEYKQLEMDSSILPYADESMDVIVINMVLHHVKDLTTMIQEIGRVLAPNGLLYITDHDCWDAVDAMLVDIEHQLYKHTADRENADQQSEREFNIYRYGNYYGWDEYFKGVLESIDGNVLQYPQPKNTIGATRQFWAVYAKPGTHLWAKQPVSK